MSEELMKFVPNVHFEMIPIKDLVSNQQYQREISMNHVRKAAENFDLYQINPVKVSRRDNVNYVFNGQHTIEIIAMVSGSRDTPVWCMIYDDLEYQTEADIFANQMKYVKPLLPYEIFMANIEAGNDEQVIIKELVESYELQIAANIKPGKVCAVSTLEKIYERYGYESLDQILRMLIKTWDGEPKSLCANFMMGLAKLMHAYPDKIQEEVFEERLSQYSINEIIRTAKDRRNGSLGYAEAFLIYYNKRLRHSVDFSPLYMDKKNKLQESVKEDDEETESADNDTLQPDDEEAKAVGT